jgi:hypothetical protein
MSLSTLRQLEEDVLERGLLGVELGDRDAGLYERAVDGRCPRGIDGHVKRAVDPCDLGHVWKRADQLGGLLQRLGSHSQAGSAAQLLDGSLGDERAGADHPDPVGDLLDFPHQLAREDDRAPALAERADEGAHLHHPGRIEPVGRLIEDQELGVLEQRGRDAEALLHANRVGPRAIGRAISQPDLVQHGLDAFLGHARVAGENAQVVTSR